MTDNGQFTVEGLGPVKELDTDLSWSPRKDFAWQWVKTDFGQTLLIKRRPEVRPRQAGNALTPPSATAPPTRKTAKTNGQPPCQPSNVPLDRGLDIDAAVNHAKEHIDDNAQVGYTVRRAARDGTIEDMVALVIAIREDLRKS